VPVVVPVEPVVPVVPVVPVDKEKNRRDPDHQEKKETDEDNGRLYLGTDIQLQKTFNLRPVKPRLNKYRCDPEKGYQDQEGAEEIGKKCDGLDDEIVFFRYHDDLVLRDCMP